MAEKKKIRLKILRQDSDKDPKRWEEFLVAWHPQMNVISALMEIQRNPETAEGKSTPPVAWDSCCLEEVCGACTMLVDGQPVKTGEPGKKAK